MSNDFKKTLVKDDRLMVTDSLNYAVKKGGQSVVSQISSAIAQSSSTVNFNLQIPSEQTIVDRRVFVKTTVQIDFQTNNCVLVYGTNVALSAFPFHQCCSTVQATLNNNVTSINIRDVLPFLIRSNDSRELQKSVSSCPSAPDSFFYPSTSGGVNSSLTNIALQQYFPGGANTSGFAAYPQLPNNQFGGLNCNFDTDIVPNGAYAGYGPEPTAVNLANDAPVTLYRLAGGLYVPQGTVTGANAQASTNWRLVFTTIEPVLCQPFLFSDPTSNRQGIYGLQTIQLQYNVADASRAFRVTEFTNAQVSTGAGGGPITITNAPQITAIANSSLQFKFLTPHPSDLLPARNVIPLLTYDRYFSNAVNEAYTANFGNKVIIQSNTYNLTQVPDKICVFLRKKMTTQRPTDNDAVPVIQNISINWNNNAGLLSSAVLQDLFQYSIDAGSNQNYSEYIGIANAAKNTNGVVNASGWNVPVSTVGSYLMLDFATVIQLTEDFYAPGSLGNFQLQFQVTTSCKEAIPASSLELILVVMNSGIMVTDRGQTSTYTGILTKQDVLDASQQEPYSVMDVKRIVGSGHCDSGRALPKHMHKGRRGEASMPKPAVVVEQSKMNSRLM
jgi:hypothetical protein